MFKKFTKYMVIFIIAITIGYILSITYKNLFNVYLKVKQNNKKVNFLENKNNNKYFPSLCFQSAYELSKETNTIFPTIFPLGTLPFKNKSGLINFDRFGFRNKDSAWEKKLHDFLILGDSVVVDGSVSDQYIFSNNFEKQSSINLGCGGNGLLTSLHLLEQIVETNYRFKNILLFLNFDNDFSKDTIREYNTNYFLKSTTENNSNIFLNKDKYALDFLNFVIEAFSKKVSNFSLKAELNDVINLEKYLKVPIKFKKTNNESEVLLEDGSIVNASLIPEGAYDTKIYNIFLKILEKITYLKGKDNINITLILVPTNKELDAYTSNKKNQEQWQKYMNYKYFKNTIASTIANFNIDILDLYNFIKENDYEGFTNGHFNKEYHKMLSIYISNNIKNKNNQLLKKLYYYNSFYPSKEYFNYQVNFGDKLSDIQIKNWLKIINSLLQNNVLDNYLLAPSLGYLFINQECQNILKLYNITNGKLLNYSVGDFFYQTCNLKNSENINKSIKKINFLIEKDVKYYNPEITTEVKKSLGLVNENR